MFNDKAYAVLTEIMGGIPDNFTPEWLDSAAAKADSVGFNGCGILSELHYIEQQARACADWMRKNGISQTAYVGGMRRNPFKRGQNVRVLAGSVVRRGGKEIVLKRTMVVTLHDGYNGYAEQTEYFRNPELLWAGSGGLWAHLDLARSPLPSLCA